MVDSDRDAAASADTATPDLFTISDLETLRLLADPMRIGIVQSFAQHAGQPRTVKQVAQALGVRPTRLYYHFNLLEEHGLLRVADSRVVSGIIEKRYLPAASNIRVDPALIAVQPAAREAAAASMAALLQGTAAELVASMAEPPPDEPAGNTLTAQAWRPHVSKSLARLMPARQAEFSERLATLVRDFDAEEASAEPADPTYGLLVAFYPLAPSDVAPTPATDSPEGDD